MATINRNLQLRDIDGNLVFPRASADNIQRSKNDGRNAEFVFKTDGKIDPSDLPSSVSAVEMLIAMAIAAPSGASAGDKYYNVTQNKIYTYSGSSWGSSETPDAGKIYLDTSTNNLYRYDGSTQMIDVSTHFTVVQDVADDPGDASSTGVPSEHAVSVALTRKQDNLTGVAPISIDGASSISLHYGTGLAVNGSDLVVPPSYITGTVDDYMMRDASPASPTTALVDGGTVYTILGNYEVNDTIRIDGQADDTKVVTEKAVRDAINAYVATGGSSVTAGKAINVDGGSINVTASTVAEVLGSTIVTGTTVAYEVAPVVQDDLSALTPNNLRSAMSLGQAVDVSCEPNVGNNSTLVKVPDYLGTMTWTKTYTASGSMGIGWFSSSASFPKFAPGLKYLFIMDIKQTNNIPITLYGYNTAVSGHGNKALVKDQVYRAAQVVDRSYTAGWWMTVPSAGDYSFEITNWRQYEVTALTDDAIAYLASLPDPDLFFRDADAHNLKNRYMIKQDMVSPFIPTIVMPNNSDLTIGAGLAYKLQITGGTHYISVDTIPENGYGWDAHLQLFVKDTSSVVFKSPLNLLAPLIPNAGHNLTVKFRNGQANVYIDDTDIGYVVTVTSGDGNGSLAYGLANSAADDYIVFADSTDGQNIILPDGFTFSQNVYIVGNRTGTTSTIITSPVISENKSFSVTNCEMTDCVGVLLNMSGSLTLNNCYIHDTIHSVKLHTNYPASEIVIGSFDTRITGCTFSNIQFPSDYTGSVWGAINFFSSPNAFAKDSMFERVGNAGRTSLFVANAPIRNCIISQCGKVEIYSGNNLISDTLITNSVGNGVVIDSNVGDNRITIEGSTFATASDNISVATGSTVTFAGVNVLNSTVSGAGQIVLADGSTITSTGDGSAGHPRGVINASGQTDRFLLKNIAFNNIVLTGRIGAGPLLNVSGPGPTLIQGCTISNNYNTSAGGVAGGLYVADRSAPLSVKDCLITGNTAVQYGAMATRFGASLTIDRCEITNNFSQNNGGPLGAVGNTASVPDHISIINCYIHGNTCTNAWQAIYMGNSAEISITGTTMDCALASSGYMSAGSCCIISLKGDNVWTNDAPVLRNTYLRFADNANITGVTHTHTSYSNTIYAEYGISVGSYNESDTVYTVGGIASVTVNGHSLSLSGIGTYINSDGTNDFTSPYMVTSSDSTGTGSLLYGLVGSTKYVVVSHSVTSCSAVLNTNVNRVLHVCTGDGRSIVGGSMSIPVGGTVTTYTPTDEHGAHMVDGSTVAILGNTASFGSMQLSGTLQLDHDCTVLPSSTITGVGGGARIAFDNIPSVLGSIKCISQNGQYSISNMTICNGIHNVRIENATASISNCIIYGGTVSGISGKNYGANILIHGSNVVPNVTITGTTVYGGNGASGHGLAQDAGLVTVSDCDFASSNDLGGHIIIRGGTINISNSTVSYVQMQGGNSHIVLSGNIYITPSGRVHGTNTTMSSGGTATLKSGCVLYPRTTVNATILGLPSFTIEDNVKMKPYNSSDLVTLTAGSYSQSKILSNGTIVAQ